MKLSLLRSRLRCVANFRPLLDTPVMETYLRLLDTDDANAFQLKQGQLVTVLE